MGATDDNDRALELLIHEQADERVKMPEAGWGEWVLTVTKIGASFMPLVGGGAGELLEALIRPQLDKRRTEWFEGIARGLYELQQQVAEVTPEKIAQSDVFTSVFLQAGQAALRTTRREKLQALRNVVLRAALPDAEEDDIHRLYIDYVDSLTTWHLDLLQYIADVRKWADAHTYPIHDPTIDPVRVFEAVHRRAMPVHDFERVLAQDLYNRGLAATCQNPYGPLYPAAQGTADPHITMLGKQFLAFIRSPLADDPDHVAPEQQQEAPHD